MGESGNKSIDDVYNIIINFNNNLTRKIEGIEKELKYISTKLDTEVAELNLQLQNVEHENLILREQLCSVEKKLKHKNLVFYGIQENQNENQKDILAKIQEVITLKLEVNDFNSNEISNAFRLGKKKDNKTRPLLIEFITSFRRNEVIRNRRKLKGSKIYISEDLSSEEIKEKALLIKTLTEVKKIDNTAAIRGKNIVIKGEIYTIYDIQAGKHQASLYQSPPSVRNVSSEPATPVSHIELLVCEPEETTAKKTENKEDTARKGVEEEKERKSQETLENLTRKHKTKKTNLSQGNHSRTRSQK